VFQVIEVSTSAALHKIFPVECYCRDAKFRTRGPPFLGLGRHREQASGSIRVPVRHSLALCHEGAHSAGYTMSRRPGATWRSPCLDWGSGFGLFR